VLIEAGWHGKIIRLMILLAKYKIREWEISDAWEKGCRIVGIAAVAVMRMRRRRETGGDKDRGGVAALG
jgi:hypothetical protein